MEKIGERLIWHYWPRTDWVVPLGGLNIITVLNTVLILSFLFLGCLWIVRHRAAVPARAQFLLEQYLKGFDSLVSSTLELESREANRKFFPLIASLFMFLVSANYIAWLPFPIFEEPTADINCTLSLGVLGVGLAMACMIRWKGFGGFMEELLGPMWEQHGVTGPAKWAGKASALFFFPLNVVGELAKVVSISFRIFGNILGGAIILIVVLSLCYSFSPLAVGMDFYFVFFIGAIQAFVFTMLTVTYIAVAIK